MIIRSGVSGRNRTDRPDPVRRTARPIDRLCPHGFMTPTRFVMMRSRFGWTETEIAGDGRCPHDPTPEPTGREIVWGPTTRGLVNRTAF